MEVRQLTQSIHYSGRELRPHWILEEFGIRGDCAVSFRGSCSVNTADLVDIEDSLDEAVIAADDMLHFICEHFLHPSLALTIMRQRALAAICTELITELSGVVPKRIGNDIFVEEDKLSVSIATVSPVSGLIHFGINVSRDGTPVPVACLDDMDIDPFEFSRVVLDRYRHETMSLQRDLSKVRPRT
ncbi:MAG: DUF366 family protein [Planctomycetota bacterium]|nr:DUF366 family protein [Planctomycetota bacterium]